MSKFSEIPWFIIKRYMDNISFYETPDKYSHYENKGGFLSGKQNIIITQNTDPMSLYVKSENSDYEALKLNVIKDWEDEDKITFKRLFSRKIYPSNEELRTVKENGYKQTTYDYTPSENDYIYDINQEDEIYSRKDSLFRKWIEYHPDQLKEFVNTEKLFLYLGKAYKIKDKYIKIFYNGFNDWVKQALPKSKRNSTLDTFIDLVFDQLYSKIYNKQKGLIRTIDPYEIDEKFVDYALAFFNTKLLSFELNHFKKRVFLDNAITWIKKKGTYSSINIIWDIISKETGNNLNIYDRWHTPSLSGDCPYPYFEDYNYIGNYENDIEYPDPENKVLSTHYKVEFDINNNPFKDYYVLPKNVVNDLYYKWEETRPITKVSHYHENVNVETDLSGNERALYSNPIYNANILSASSLKTETADDVDIHIQNKAAEVWDFEHKLNTKDVLIEVFNTELEKIVPNNIKIVNENKIRAFFPSVTSGTMFAIKTDYTSKQGIENTEWNIAHQLEERYVIPQLFSSEDEFYYPRDVFLEDKNSLKVINSTEMSGYGHIAKPEHVHIQNEQSDKWIINHNLGYTGNIVAVYNENDYIIKPLNIFSVDENNTEISFSKSIKGVASIKTVGSPAVTGNLITYFDGDWKVEFGNSTDTINWDYADENKVKNKIWTIYFDANNFEKIKDYGAKLNINIPKGFEGYFSEIGIFDKHNKIRFHWRGDLIYKHKNMIFNINYKIKNQYL